MISVVTTEQVTSLLRRTQLLPGESLPSLLERLAQLNYYPHSGVLGWICRERISNSAPQDNIACPKQAQTFFQLARLAQISPDELFAASDHRFAPTLTPPGKVPVLMLWPEESPKATMTSALAHRRLTPTSAARFCPLCLETSAYHRLSWVPTAAAICLQHQCLLAHQCPQCGSCVSVAEIVKRCCKTCQADLSAAPVVSVADDAMGILSQQAIQHWLSLVSAPALPDGYTLLQQPPAVLYRLLYDLCRGLIACQKEWPCLPAPLDGLVDRASAPIHLYRQLTPTQAFYLYRAAFTGILNWPQGLFRLLDAFAQRNLTTQTSSRATIRLGPLWCRWLWKAWRRSQFEFLHQSLVDYLMARGIFLPYPLLEHFKERPWFIARTGLWSAQRTAQALDISIQGLCQFLPNGPLSTCLWPDSRPSMPLFERDKVLAVKQEWKTG
ncbi:MAG: TniQ family protein [Chloroflexi bacterium]|nr:TniQ family protein [Chloroflexota bacterium]